ncbi:hypothetical protein [Pleomorphovibrio marinus]|uniref:hypothetical protein n=1 Tax=Pleomorphovibrio marinus TaxID=2164132 RepID=UPI000E0B824B|nr:hypothetical protein [Pleomorphovibrio marinus]
MKKFFKKPILLIGSLAAVIGLGYYPNNNQEVNAQNTVKYCQWTGSVPCDEPMVDKNCVCDDQC